MLPDLHKSTTFAPYPFDDPFFAALDVPCWRPVLYTYDDEHDHLEESHGIKKDDSRIARIEQWIVSCEQYLFVERDEFGVWHGPYFGEEALDGTDLVYPQHLDLVADLHKTFCSAGERDILELHPNLR